MILVFGVDQGDYEAGIKQDRRHRFSIALTDSPRTRSPKSPDYVPINSRHIRSRRCPYPLPPFAPSPAATLTAVGNWHTIPTSSVVPHRVDDFRAVQAGAVVPPVYRQ